MRELEKMKLTYRSYELIFHRPAGTSRGVMQTRKGWYIEIEHDGKTGLGEVAPLPGLSRENLEEIPDFLVKLDHQLKGETMPTTLTAIEQLALTFAADFPSIRFGLEQALLDLLHGGQQHFFYNDFTAGKTQIPINGLIWMGDKEYMQHQLKEKLALGYNCIKLKIGALDFETEISLIKQIREVSDDIIIRVDANGAFGTNDVMQKLEKLARYHIHSIEQPIKPGQFDAMKTICNVSPVPIALDEELIYLAEPERQERISYIQPHFLVLKPSLLGGFKATREWIELAEKMTQGWWITSALESNLGLGAIAQFTGNYQQLIHQGLGTGRLFVSNTPTMTTEDKGWLSFAHPFVRDNMKVS